MRWLDRLKKRGGESAAKRSFFADVFSVLTTRIAVFGFTFLSGVLMARLLGTEGRGLVAALMFAPLIVLAFCELGLRRSTAFHIGQQKDTPENIVATLAALGGLTALLAAVVCALFLWATWLPEYSWVLAGLAVLSIPGTVAASYSGGVFLGLQQIPQFSRSNWVLPFLRLLLIALLAGVLAWGAEGVLIAYAAAAILAGAYAVYRVGRLVAVRVRLDRELAASMVRLGLGFAGALFVLTLLDRINFLILQQTGDLGQLGLFALGMTLAEYIWQIPAVMSETVFSRGANATDAKAFTQKLLVLFRVTILAAIAASIAMALAAPFVIPLVYGAEFAGSATVLVAMLPGVTAFTAYRILHQDLASKGRPWISLAVTVPAIPVNVGFGLWLIPMYGAVGAGMATSLTYCLAAAMFLIVYARALGIPILEIVAYRRSDWHSFAARVPYLRSRIARPSTLSAAKTPPNKDEPK